MITKEILYRDLRLTVGISKRSGKHCSPNCHYYSEFKSGSCFCLLNIEAPDRLKTEGDVLKKALRIAECIEGEELLRPPPEKPPRRV